MVGGQVTEASALESTASPVRPVYTFNSLALQWAAFNFWAHPVTVCKAGYGLATERGGASPQLWVHRDAIFGFRFSQAFCSTGYQILR